MKKSKITLLLMSLFFMMTGVVLAKESVFEREWRDQESFNLDYYQNSPVLNLQYQNGYVSIYSLETDDGENNEIYVRYYDHDGNIIKSSKVNNLNDNLEIRLIDAVTSDDNIYLFVYVYDNSNSVYKYQIMRLNDGFDADKISDVYSNRICDKYNCSKSFSISQASEVAPHYGMSTLSIYDDRLYILGEYFNIISFDLDLNSDRKDINNEDLVKKIFPSFYYLAKLTVEDYGKYYTKEDYENYHYRESSSYYEEVIRRAKNNYYLSADSNSDYIVFSSIPNGCDNSYFYWLYLFYPQWVQSVSENELDEISNGDYGISTIDCLMPIPSIGLLEKGDFVWSVENEDYIFFPIVKLVGNYIVALGVNYDSSDIVIYDLDGKLVQTIKVSNSSEDEYNVFNYLNSTSTGFLVSDIYRSTECSDDHEVCQVLSTTEHYSISYNIRTIIDGEGEAIVNGKSFAEKKETIEIKPKDGYKLESIVVTDSDGNVIELRDNVFTMPSSDVLVEIKFVLEEEEKEFIINNPNTDATSMTGLILATLVLVLIVKYNYKKFKFLK